MEKLAAQSERLASPSEQLRQLVEEPSYTNPKRRAAQFEDSERAHPISFHFRTSSVAGPPAT